MGARLGDAGELRGLFVRALQLTPEQRAEFLSDLTIDKETREELQALLDADTGSETFLQETVAGDPPATPAAGERIGPYEIREALGQGGMGAVFRAERVDGELLQTVAIKVVRHSWFDPRAVDRFRNERQLLAGLAHGNIARLLDGGTRADGVVWLAMEFVDGVPLDRYCDQRGLGIPERLRLFLPLCDAVEYAHQKLIIHRDLKPSNVLVTAEGEPKLLDFGIAKALDDSPAGDTRTLALTPDYASPEQARGDTATTVTDVYGLGGVLYFLLTGRPTHTVAGLSPSQLQRAICEIAPLPPSQLRPELKGDLENILLKALHTDPARRYRSVRELREDLDRFLERRPVFATRDGWAYHARRFLQRHALASAASALAALAVGAGTVTALYQAHRAERRFTQVRTLANHFVFDFEAAIHDTPGTLAARRMVAATAREYLADLAARAGNDRGLNRELAESYYRLSVVETSAGESDAGINHLKRSLALLRQVRDDCCGTPAQRAHYVDELTNLSIDQSDATYHDDSLRSVKEAIRIARTLTATSSRDSKAAISLASALRAEGTLFLNQGKLEPARRDLQESMAQAAAVYSSDSGDDEAGDVQAMAGYSLARALDPMGEPARALSVARDSRRILEELLARHPENIRLRRQQVYLLDYLGDFLFRLSAHDASLLAQASEPYQEANELARAGVRRNPGDRGILECASFAAMKLANHLDHQHRAAEAIPILRESIAASDELVRNDPSNRRNLYIQVSNQHLMATYLVNLQRWADAATALAKSEELMTAALNRSPGDLQLLGTQIAILLDRTTTERNLGHLAAARSRCRQALDLTATLIARKTDSKRPIGSHLADLRREARLLGVPDFTLTVPGIE
jgi:tetratricopeptide (TPR) repeat protein/tRNA A-37 threonylcarbamoyl transferase component Bud32